MKFSQRITLSAIIFFSNITHSQVASPNGKFISNTSSFTLSFSESDMYNLAVRFYNTSHSTKQGALFLTMVENGTAYMAFGRERDGPAFDEKMRLTTNGNLGIGTISTGTHRLAVKGSIGAREVKVESISDWSDFVFDKNYKLPKLEVKYPHLLGQLSC